jgi:membrane protein DedA with SNARE-associated domain
MSLRYIFSFLIHYKYFAIFPIAVVEGPLVSIVSGFLVSRGYLGFIPVLIVVFLGDVISDSVFYFLGRGGMSLVQKFKFLHLSEERINILESQYRKHPWKTMILAKISYGLGSVFMVASGISRMSFARFLEYVCGLNFIRSFMLVLVGYYFGKVALHFGQMYFGYYVTAVMIAVPLGFYIYHIIKKRRSGIY